MKRVFTIALLWFAARLSASDFNEKFAIVMIDDRTEAKYGAFPYDRGLIAQGIDGCTRAGAKAVVLKFFFDQPKTASGDAALRTAMTRIPVALQARLESFGGTTKPIPARFSWAHRPVITAVGSDRAWVPLSELMEAAARVGFVDFSSTDIPLAEEYRGIPYKSLIVCCLELALDQPAEVEPGRIRFGPKILPVDGANVFRARLPEHEALPIISFSDLLAGGVRSSEIGGKVVILGWDGRRTPTLATQAGVIRIHRFFVECLFAAWLGLKG